MCNYYLEIVLICCGSVKQFRGSLLVFIAVVETWFGNNYGKLNNVGNIKLLKVSRDVVDHIQERVNSPNYRYYIFKNTEFNHSLLISPNENIE